MLPFVIPVITAAIDLIGTWWKNREEIKREEHASAIEIAKAETTARIDYIRTGQKNDADWELESIKQAGWKDEWLTILLSIPLVMCFIPGLDVYVTRGFASLETTPLWYQAGILVIIASAFGFKKITDFIGAWKGSK